MKNFKNFRISNLILPALGLASLIWFLIRVIPKPSRAAYPCMKTAAPMASSFVIYILGLFTTAFIFAKAKIYLHQSKFFLFSIALMASIIIAFVSLTGNEPAKAYNVRSTVAEGPNQPMGEGIGTIPGRVAWVYNPSATNENCNNDYGNFWYEDKNTNQNEVNSMFGEGLKMITNASTEAAAWDSIFHYYNRTHGRGNVGYKAGEKIVMKINQNSGFDPDSNINTSPQIVFAVVRSLVDEAKVDDGSIGFGDPLSNTGDLYVNKISSTFPDVEFWGNSSGRIELTESTEKIYSSDGTHSSFLPQNYVDATYMINIPVLKKHHRAGISLSSKNHFGSLGVFEGGAWNWHFSLPCPNGGGDVSNGAYGSYRCFVDIMGHEHLGGKTILYLVDGLWSSINWGHVPIKWRMSPFNNDWPSSLFMSQDPVAIESVGFDFLFSEFGTDNPDEGEYDPGDNHGPFPTYEGVDDFLHQAADSKNWAVDYDPEQDGKILPSSMGAHEHWNDVSNKQYSRNLGLNKGIDLATKLMTGVASKENLLKNFHLSAYPNPFVTNLSFTYQLEKAADINLIVYDMKGAEVKNIALMNVSPGEKELKWDGSDNAGLSLSKGSYAAKLIVKSGKTMNYQTVKFVKR